MYNFLYEGSIVSLYNTSYKGLFNGFILFASALVWPVDQTQFVVAGMGQASGMLLKHLVLYGVTCLSKLQPNEKNSVK